MNDVSPGYAGHAWADGPDAVYDRLAAALVAACPVPLAGGRALDVGAGTGAASRAILARGGCPVAVDLSLDMLRHDRATRPAAAVGDARRLPFADAAFDAVVLAFVLSHLSDPLAALAEARRVARAGGAVLAASFSSASSHPCKSQVDDVAARWGWRPPAWYRRLKDELEPLVGAAASLVRLAADAQLEDIVVEQREVVMALSGDALVAWRLGMAHLAPFVASLPATERAVFVGQARAAVGPQPEPLRAVVLILSSRAPAQADKASA